MRVISSCRLLELPLPFFGEQVEFHPVDALALLLGGMSDMTRGRSFRFVRWRQFGLGHVIVI